MIGATSGLEKSVKCSAAVTAFTAAKFGADDDTAVVATAVADNIIGVFQHSTGASGDEVRLMLNGITRLLIGGNVTRGDWLTVDGSGRGVSAAPAAGVNNNVIGRAMASGVSGDIIPALLEAGRIQG